MSMTAFDEWRQLDLPMSFEDWMRAGAPGGSVPSPSLLAFFDYDPKHRWPVVPLRDEWFTDAALFVRPQP
ncbi:MAG: hypothetical protein GY788_20990 [bacterium]|nr:hypothetical protein [bacterium]